MWLIARLGRGLGCAWSCRGCFGGVFGLSFLGYFWLWVVCGGGRARCFGLFCCDWLCV